MTSVGFCSTGLFIHPVEGKLDALDAITPPLYLDGVLVGEDADSETLTHHEMSLELKLNLAAFYLRLCHFSFTNGALVMWSKWVRDKCLYYDEIEVDATAPLTTTLGITNLNAGISLEDNRLGWSNHF